MNPELNLQENVVEKVEQKSSVLNSVTPLSKYLAMFLFITMPFVGGWIGYKYSPEKVVEVEKIVTIEVPISEKEVVPKTIEDLSTLTVKSLPVIYVGENGTYLDFNATASKYISTEVNNLNKVDGNLYVDKEHAYLLKKVVNDCTDAVENKLVQIDTNDINSLEIIPINYYSVIKGPKEVFVDFLKVNADPASFEYLGELAYRGSALEGEYISILKDKDRVFLIKYLYDLCAGDRITDIQDGSDFAQADISTFEYLGKDPAEIAETNLSYAKDKNYFYWFDGILSKEITPQTCLGDFFKECLPKIQESLKDN